MSVKTPETSLDSRICSSAMAATAAGSFHLYWKPTFHKSNIQKTAPNFTDQRKPYHVSPLKASQSQSTSTFSSSVRSRRPENVSGEFFVGNFLKYSASPSLPLHILCSCAHVVIVIIPVMFAMLLGFIIAYLKKKNAEKLFIL